MIVHWTWITCIQVIDKLVSNQPLFNIGIAHGQELQYVFGYPYINQTYMDVLGVYPRQRYDYADRNMSEYMISLWTNFSAFGFVPSVFHEMENLQ